MALLNLFIMVSHASGVSNVLAMTRFLDEAIHEPLRMGVLSWPVTFECLVLYLRMVEACIKKAFSTCKVNASLYITVYGLRLFAMVL